MPNVIVAVELPRRDLGELDMQTRRMLAIGTSFLLLAGASFQATSSASTRGARGGTRFDGSCSVQGTVTFDPPATTVPQPLTYDYRAQGTCTGLLDNKEIDAPVKLRQWGRSEGSCARAETTAPGRGRISFPNGKKLHYRVEFTSIATEIDFTFRGTHSGTADGHGTFETDRTPPDTAAKCATGVRKVPMDMTLETESPLVSRRPHRSSR